MAEVTPFPGHGEFVFDVRGEERALRVSWHHDQALVVLSLWRQDRCIGTFRLAREDVPALVNALVAGLVPWTPEARSQTA